MGVINVMQRHAVTGDGNVLDKTWVLILKHFALSPQQILKTTDKYLGFQDSFSL